MIAFRFATIRRLLFTVLVLGAISCAARAADDTMNRARLEKMLADGDTGMIVQVFKRHPGRTLPFIDQYLEGGLAMIEKGEDPAKALLSFRIGIKFAVLADQAFEGTAFSDYANSFASFSPSEQKQFREGQKAFKEGMKESDLRKAQQHLQGSLELAQSLGDTWGQAMAWSGLAEMARKGGDDDAAIRAATQAIELTRQLQLRVDCVQALLLAASIFEMKPEPEGKVKGRTGQAKIGYLAQAWILANGDIDITPALHAEVFKQYIEALEAVGMKDRADVVRRENRHKFEPIGATTAPAN